jgi:secreted PhoX family phosphatase
MTLQPESSAIADESIGVNASTERRFADIVDTRMSRRALLGGVAASAVMAAAPRRALAQVAISTGLGSTLTFTEVATGPKPDHAVAPGYNAQVLVRWGDKVMAGAPAFDVNKQSATAQSTQWGYNNDFLAFMPLPVGSTNSDHGVLFSNHEYTELHMMFPGLDPKTMVEKATPEMVDVELAAHGASIVEIRKEGSQWKVVEGSRYARRISARDTNLRISGPAARQARLKTSIDPTGAQVVGMLNNCGGGTTPWGTVLTAEENFNGYFAGDITKTPEERNYTRYGFNTRPRREGAQRGQPLRLDRRDRPLRSGLDAGEAHRARPFQARGRHRVGQCGRKAHGLFG